MKCNKVEGATCIKTFDARRYSETKVVLYVQQKIFQYDIRNNGFIVGPIHVFNVSVILINDNMQSRLSSPMLSGGSRISGKGRGGEWPTATRGWGWGVPLSPSLLGRKIFKFSS